MSNNLIPIHHHINYIFVFVIDMQPDIVDKKHDKQLIVKMAGYLEKKGRMVSNGLYLYDIL